MLPEFPLVDEPAAALELEVIGDAELVDTAPFPVVVPELDAAAAVELDDDAARVTVVDWTALHRQFIRVVC